MTLDIVVPHYKEPWDVCRYLFDSISMQELVDWTKIRVILVNDGNDVIFPTDVFKKYPFKVEYLLKKNEGVSAARNHGLDHATADYVMFCDCDDGFLSNLALYLMTQEAEHGEPPMINPVFIEEAKADNGQVVLAVHKHDPVFVHGKMYRREWLIENEIRFPYGMNLHEDLYFNSLAIATAKETIRELSNPMYLWRYNKNSVVRSDDLFLLRTYPQLVAIWKKTCEWMKKHAEEFEYKSCVCKFIISAYYTFQLDSFMSSKNAKMRKEAEKAVRDFYMEFYKDFHSTDDKTKAKSMHDIRADAELHGFKYEVITMGDWIKHIEYDVK